MHYNHIPLWIRSPHLRQIRGRWLLKPKPVEEQSKLQTYISWMKTFVQTASMWNMADQQMKYAEVMAVAGGVTAVQGSPSSNTDAWDSMLTEYRVVQLWWRWIHTKATTLESDYTGSYITSGNSSGSLNAWYSIFPRVSMNQAVLNSTFLFRTTSWSENWSSSWDCAHICGIPKDGRSWC